MRPSRSGHRENNLLFALVLLMSTILSSCSFPRYIFVDSRNDVDFDNGDQRYVCLTKEDARLYRNYLAIRSKAEIEQAQRQRMVPGSPVEQVLYAVITGEYLVAYDILEKNWEAVPEYLRLLLKADLASETGNEKVSSGQLVALYQDAFEIQTCDLNRDIIKLRIRQLRYGR